MNDMASTSSIPEAAPSEAPSGNRRSHKYMLVIASIVVLLSVFLPLPTGGKLVVFGVESPPLCVFQAKLGIDCPGCGLTRSFVSMGHIDIVQAWEFNRVGPLFFFVFFFQIPYRIMALWDRRLQLNSRRWDLTYPVIALLMIINWIVNFFI
ncbi:MAG: DUF2752 domain-containing protein [Planctomycetota bacterium]|nr:DUF2752 domain-containing protein [Planctomycetota bacterium]